MPRRPPACSRTPEAVPPLLSSARSRVDREHQRLPAALHVHAAGSSNSSSSSGRAPGPERLLLLPHMAPELHRSGSTAKPPTTPGLHFSSRAPPLVLSLVPSISNSTAAPASSSPSPDRPLSVTSTSRTAPFPPSLSYFLSLSLSHIPSAITTNLWHRRPWMSTTGSPYAIPDTPPIPSSSAAGRSAAGH